MPSILMTSQTMTMKAASKGIQTVSLGRWKEWTIALRLTFTRWRQADLDSSITITTRHSRVVHPGLADMARLSSPSRLSFRPERPRVQSAKRTVGLNLLGVTGPVEEMALVDSCSPLSSSFTTRR
jgi:hypothetical protein